MSENHTFLHYSTSCRNDRNGNFWRKCNKSLNRFCSLIFFNIFASVRYSKSFTMFCDLLFSTYFPLKDIKNLTKLCDSVFYIFVLKNAGNFWQALVIYLLWHLCPGEAQIIKHNIHVKIFHVNIPLSYISSLGNKVKVKNHLWPWVKKRAKCRHALQLQKLNFFFEQKDLIS